MTGMVSDSAERLFSQYVPPVDQAPAFSLALWHAVEEVGFPYALLTEEDGGFGLEPMEALEILRIAGKCCVAAPIGETMVANWLLAQAGLPLADGPAAIQAERSNGTADSPVPWGRSLSTLVLYKDQGGTAVIRRIAVDQDCDWSEDRNLADEPRDHLSAYSAAAVETDRSTLPAETPMAVNALVRVMQMAGALDAVLDLSIAYASDRNQFGRPIAKFQAIQQSMAILAGEVAAAGAAASMAAQAFPLATSDPRTFNLLVAAAKVRTGDAAGKAADLSHQIHGAIGFSREYALHPLTRRLWSWRDEYGAEAAWAEMLGAAMAFPSHPTSGLWAEVTRLQAGAF